MLQRAYSNMRFSKLLALAVLCAPSIAAAHLRITSPTPRFSDQRLKQRHCGELNSTRVAANVQTRKPGSMMKLVWDRYVPHPGWIRVSFQQNGDIFDIPAPDLQATNQYPMVDRTGQTDQATGSVIIKDRLPDITNEFTFQLPNVECNNCSVQVIQMMTDKPPYTTDLQSDDIYFACVDLVLSNGAPEVPVDPMPNNPTPNNPNGNNDPTDEPDDGSVSGGCNAAGAPSVMALIAFAGLRRRRRSK